MIRAEGLGKRFGSVQAIRDVSLQADDGRITALLGPNGAGKSTTLRILATVLRPDSGSAWVDGHDVRTDPAAVRRAIGVLPHGAGLYERLTARENVAYFGALHGLTRKALDARVDALVDQLDMGEFAGTPGGRLFPGTAHQGGIGTGTGTRPEKRAARRAHQRARRHGHTRSAGHHQLSSPRGAA